MHVCGALIRDQHGVSTNWGVAASNGFLRGCDSRDDLAHMLRRAGSLTARNARDLALPQSTDRQTSCDLRPRSALLAFPARTQVRIYAHKEVSCMLQDKPPLRKFQAGSSARIYRLNDLHDQMTRSTGWKSFLAEPKNKDAWNGCFVCFDQPPPNLPPKT